MRLLGVETIGFYCRYHVARLERNDHVMIALRFGDLDVTESAFNHGGWARETVLLDQLALQTAGVDADPHGNAFILGFADDLTVTIVTADIARINADLIDRVIEGRQRHLVIEMNVANERDMDAFLDFT